MQQVEAQRPDTENTAELPPKFAPEEEVTHFDSDAFRIHYTEDGINAVPTLDANDNGVPDFVEQTAIEYEAALTFFRDGLGLLTPLSDLEVADGNGGDERFDVYLVDFAGRGDGAYRRERCEGSKCAGYMLQENDYAGYGYPSTQIATRILASHELFHAVQAAYDSDLGSNFSEGTAAWASEQFDPSLDDFEHFATAYLQSPESSLDLDPAGAAVSLSYGMSIFFQFLTERFSRDIVIELIEDCTDGAHGVGDPKWVPTLAALLEREHGTTFADVFAEFAAWNIYTNASARLDFGYKNSVNYSPIKFEDQPAPLKLERKRFFRNSTRYYRVATTSNTMRVALRADDPNDLKDMRLYAAPITSSVQLGIGTTDVANGLDIDATGARSIIIAVINTALEGNSRRPNLCVADPIVFEQHCSAVSEMDAGVIDAGTTPDAGMNHDAGMFTDASTPVPESDDTCTAGQHGSSTISLVAFSLFWVHRRRRQ